MYSWARGQFAIKVGTAQVCMLRGQDSHKTQAIQVEVRDLLSQKDHHGSWLTQVRTFIQRIRRIKLECRQTGDCS